MFDDLYSKERSASLGQMIQRPEAPPPEDGVFKGFGSALADSLPHAALTAASAWSAMLDAFGKAQAYANAPTVAMMHNESQPDLDQLKRDTIGQMGNSDTARMFRDKAKQFAPDPAAVGVAGQIAHGLVSSLGKAVTYSAAGPVGPVLFGADMGTNRAQELSDQGVDGGTAAAAGLVTGITSAAGLKLPPALGATRLQSIAIGAGINPAMGVLERGTIHALLEHADYPAIAAQYKPFDPMQMAVEATAGAAFGGLFHSAKVREGATLTPEEHAALLTMNEVRTRDADTLTKPGDIVAAGQAHDAQLTARGQLDSGEQVSVAHMVPADPVQMAAEFDRFSNSITPEMRAELLGAKPEESAPSISPRTYPADQGQALIDSGLIRPTEGSLARERVATNPEMLIRLEDGSEVRAADALRQAEENITQTNHEARAFQVAIACAMRYAA